ncbi:putative F-box/FBD/LRR-repeat protein At3g59240 isoform X1 [Eutrema salsugineum]|uniref:putative F-box/FBD/LRR-repeat protein At3g59240 isoform X1 n=1 Tax=Eutrema salsugineum TaxID=72664 RepID=UPI000CECE7EC|nr:putative F-box/FBD/LRR-repeat protein At3g59240 isoform X1 [Eutrema salsugineum]
MVRGVSDLDLRVTVNWADSMPSIFFVSKSLVRLRIVTEDGPVIDVEDVFLPKLKTLHLDSLVFKDGDNYLVKVISGCPVLEELVMIDLGWDDYWNRSVSSKTLKRLTLRCQDWDNNPDSVSFDTPNLVYFEYCDHVADKYEIVSFDSLVEAKIGLRMTREQRSHGHGVSNARDLLMRISNVHFLYLFATTLETHRDVGWGSLAAILKNSPNLETLVFEELHHNSTFKCDVVDGCLCKPSENIPSCLSSSPVKVVKILKFGDISFYCDDTEKQMKLVKYFLEIMPNLERMILCYNTRIDEDLKSQLERLVSRGASLKCSVQLICDNLSEPLYPFSFFD